MNARKNVMNIEEKPFRKMEARKMDEVQMKKDMDYTFAQRILKGMCEKGLISVALYKDLDELKSVIDAAEDTYDEKNAKYNEALEALKEGFERIDIEWLQEVISEDGLPYELVNYDANEAANDILQEEYCFDAYEERLDMYAEDAVNRAMETYSCLHGDFSEEADTFLSEIEKILSQLNKALRFAEKWKAAKVNPEIDNTR